MRTEENWNGGDHIKVNNSDLKVTQEEWDRIFGKKDKIPSGSLLHPDTIKRHPELEQGLCGLSKP